MSIQDSEEMRSWRQAWQEESTHIDEDEKTGEEIAEEIHLTLGDDKEVRPRGGIKFSDKKMMSFQRKVGIDWVKDIGLKMVQRQDLSRVSMPVKLFEPRSYLQRLTDPWVVAPEILHDVADADPLDQMRAVVTFALSGLIRTVTQWKPFNPILGETFQCHLDDGTKFYLEQTSHHPPISHWFGEAPNKEWVFTGVAKWWSSWKGNSVKGTQGGTNKIKFKNGTEIFWTNPDFWLGGILWGERVAEYRGSCSFSDYANGIEAKIDFDPDKPGMFRGWFSSSRSPSDTIRGDITEDGKKKGTFNGSWITHIDYEGEQQFNMKSHKYRNIIQTENCLPSDTRHRTDLINLLEGDFEKAQICKIELEEIQRRDRKLRKGKGVIPDENEDSKSKSKRKKKHKRNKSKSSKRNA